MATILAWWGGSPVVPITPGLLADRTVTGGLPGLVSDSRERYSPARLRLPHRPAVVMSLGTEMFFGRWKRLCLAPCI